MNVITSLHVIVFAFNITRNSELFDLLIRCTTINKEIFPHIIGGIPVALIFDNLHHHIMLNL
jgi:hypothetical protein